MTRPDWAFPNSQGPELYAPADRRMTEEPRNGARVTVLRPQAAEPTQPNDRPEAHLDALIRRVAGSSMDEIDSVIRELEGVRELLRSEGERVCREIAGYASLSHASMNAMKVISDSLKVWKGVSDRSA